MVTISHQHNAGHNTLPKNGAYFYVHFQKIFASIYRCKYIYTPYKLDRTLIFECADNCLYLFINGDFAGNEQVSHSFSEFDITPFMHEGENSIICIVLKWCDGTYLEDQDKIRMSGIIRDVYIVSRLQKRIADYLITADTENFSFTWNNCDATVILALPNKNIVFSEAVKKGEIAPKILKTPTDIFDVVSQGYLSPAFQHFPLLHKC